ncbi:F-box/kelch-repeat protein At1g16250-like [Rutidosis leptorrhynchoides]|uniref:F-box/kelch-repeat protein At1g16250-like n=1 Tax=Rutidosis leptorrhynchoides TaxID=125765 RepID=UPI003A9A5483
MSSLASLSRQDEDSPQYCVYASFSAKSPSTETTNISNWIECYNPLSNNWHRVTSIPGLLENHVLKGFSMVIMNDYIYIIGGLLCHNVTLEGDHDSNDGCQIDVEVLQSVRCYNITNDTWNKCAPLNIARYDFACTVSGNKIYIAGGKFKTDSVKGVSSSEVYDPALDEWELLPKMSTLRYKCVGVTWQQRIYVVGGFTEYETNDIQGPFSMTNSSAEVYDTINNKWDFLPRMWDLDVPPNQIVVAGGQLFSCGDCYIKWKGYIENFDRELNMWNAVDGSSLSSPTSMLDFTSPKRPLMEQMYLTIAPIETRLYFLAGYKMNGETSKFRSEVHVFDTSRDGGVWMNFEPVIEDGEKELSCHCAVYRKA